MQLKWPMLWDLFSLFPAYAGVILAAAFAASAAFAFPRIRGGDPLLQQKSLKQLKLFPAYAGVIPAAISNLQTTSPFPRIRGGDPWEALLPDLMDAFSPHTRG